VVSADADAQGVVGPAGGVRVMTEAFVGRQPIFNRELEFIGAELLYRDSHENRARVNDATAASRSTVVTAFTEIGIDTLVGNGVAYVNFAEEMLLNLNAEALPPSKVVIEVLEHVPATPEVIKALHRLKEAGYTIALDDFVYTPSREALIPLADIVKIEVMDKIVMQQTLAALEPYDVKLLAEKVEDQADMRMCLDLGFDYFQGYFLCRPEVVVGEKLPANRMATLQLVSKLSDPSVDFDTLVELVSSDVSLTYRLLRYLNSAHFALRQPLTDVRQAMGLLGYNKLRAWVALVAMSSVDDKPAELVRIGIVRARMCELLADALDVDGPTAFTVGLFSILDALFDREMGELIGPLPLDEPLKAALIDRDGALGQLITYAEQYEAGRWRALLQSDFEPVRLVSAYIEANKWTTETLAALAE
jgi:EAL and modified HD-GYP domain-containing signal transduction protein